MTVRFNPLRNPQQMSELISSVTGEPTEQVLERLHDEFRYPGSEVGSDFKGHGLTPHVWDDGLVEFYQQTDAFLYELSMWNCNRLKRRMRLYTRRALQPLRSGDPKLDVLTVGDGLGFDCLSLARAGHRTTYFEMPGYSSRFAKTLFGDSGVDIPMITNPTAIPHKAFDAVVCLDVLEHVPDPAAMVGDLVGYLRDDGLLIAHAPFYLIDATYPTHLRANRRFSGDLTLYGRHGLKLVDAAPFWNPLVLSRQPRATQTRSGAATRRKVAKLVGWLFRFARLTTIPFRLALRYQRHGSRWFGDTWSGIPETNRRLRQRV